MHRRYLGFAFRASRGRAFFGFLSFLFALVGDGGWAGWYGVVPFMWTLALVDRRGRLFGHSVEV